MPNLIETADFIAGLRTRRVAFDAAWCTRMRHRKSGCSACMDACPHEAVSWDGRALAIDADACTECGACACACPTQALTLNNPGYPRIFARLEALAAQTPPTRLVLFCCEKVQGAHESVDPELIALPCLAAIDEAVLTFAACCGFGIIGLADGGCAACANALANERIEQTCSEARSMLSLWGLPTKLRRRSFDATGHPALSGVGRRDLIEELAGQAKETAITAAANAYGQAEHTPPPTLAATLTKEGGGLKTRSVPRNETLLNCLFERPEVPEGHWDTRLFGRLSLDTQRCRHCGLCGFFCPTGAITYTGEPQRGPVMGMAKPTATTGHHEFRACDCVACGLCADICLGGALELKRGIAFDDLFNLEPKQLD